MKKNWIIAAFAVMGLVTTSSCKNDDDVSSEKPIILTPSEGKQALENNSIEVLNKVNEFRNDTALKDVEEFLNYFNDHEEDTIEPIYNTNDSHEYKKEDHDHDEDHENEVILKSVLSTMSIVSEVKNNRLSATKLPNAVIKNITATQKTDLEIEFDEAEGTHTWNEQKDEFEYVGDNSGKIVYNVTQNGKTAVLTISNFTAYTHASGEDAPKSIKAELTIGNTKVMGVDYTATIATNEYLPSNVSTSISLGALSYTGNLTNNNTTGSISQSLAIGDTKILGLDINNKGSYTDINTTGDSNKEINLLLNSADATISLGKTTIKLNAKAPATVQNKYTVDEEVELLNNMMDISITSGIDKVANGEFYKKEFVEKDVLFADHSKYHVYTNNSTPGNYHYPNNNKDSLDIVKSFDTSDEYWNSDYNKTYNIFEKPKIFLEKNIITTKYPWIYINEKYPNSETSEGKHIDYDEISSVYNYDKNAYEYTINIYYNGDFVKIESNVVSDKIWDYVQKKYPNRNDIDYARTYQYTSFVFWYEDVNREEPDMKLLFDDGSKATLEAYFEFGFDKLISTAEETEKIYSDID